MRLPNVFKRKSAPRQNRHQDSLRLEVLEPRLMLSTVQIFAAGVEGEEIMQLEIDGADVQS